MHKLAATVYATYTLRIVRSIAARNEPLFAQQHHSNSWGSFIKTNNTLAHFRNNMSLLKSVGESRLQRSNMLKNIAEARLQSPFVLFVGEYIN